VLEGTVTYAGPLPCTEKDHVVGAAALLLFDVNLLPPPDGLGTSAASLANVAGDTLFAGVRDRLTFHGDGSRWCPDAGSKNVTVSSTWTAGPLIGGEYEVRGFYDLDGDFDPTFLIANEPTKGDIGGGAIDNAADVLVGKPPVYRRIALGRPPEGRDAKIPDAGARNRRRDRDVGAPARDRATGLPRRECRRSEKKSTPLAVQMASDFQLDTFSVADPTGTQASFVSLTFGAGVASNEIDDATKSPFLLPGRARRFSTRGRT